MGILCCRHGLPILTKPAKEGGRIWQKVVVVLKVEALAVKVAAVDAGHLVTQGQVETGRARQVIHQAVVVVMVHPKASK